MNKSASLPPRRLEVTDLACARGERVVFEGLNFRAAPGDAILLRGPNGAGKTSLLLCLAGLIRASAGMIVWTGRDPEIAADLHLVGHRAAVKPGLSVRENLQFWAAVNGGHSDKVAPALADAGLEHAADLDTALLSAGQIRRLALCRLLVADRPVWLLDEPTASLDAAASQWIAGLIDSHRTAGGLVIAATHLDLGLKNPRRVSTITLGEVA